MITYPKTYSIYLRGTISRFTETSNSNLASRAIETQLRQLDPAAACRQLREIVPGFFGVVWIAVKELKLSYQNVYVWQEIGFP